MIRRILYHFLTRLLTALLSFAVVWLTAHYLGAAGRGSVSLFVTDCAVVLLLTGLLGGSSLIYLSPRYSSWQLLVPAYGWALLVCTTGTAVIGLLRTVPPGYLLHVWLVTVCQALLSVNTALLLGRKRETAYNLLTVAQVLLLAGGLLVAFLSYWERTVAAYYYAAYAAYGLPLLLSLGALWQLPDRWRTGQPLRLVARELAYHSRSAHFSNILTFINYRLSYYFVAHYVDVRALGVLSVGVSLAEALWLIPRSTALIQYVDLIHAADKQAQLAPTLRTTRLTLLATGVGLVVLCALPGAVLARVFGPEFGATRAVLWWLLPGILAVALNIMCSTYFSGLECYRINNVAAGLGVAVTLPACAYLIPRYGISGAALAMSLSYATATVYLLRHFLRDTGTRLPDLLPGPADIAYGRALARKWLLLPSVAATPAERSDAS
ncbi:polysaccharide biosynthesis C-terminal domain-containing protein [Hymenobacter sp. BT507]|uniref:Polysaccharide biosynthesis C-terminal domain-containing protein n=1 Tax=Hymenobacter citatus TaxID=2763506 RepID=A0ABR7MLL5_9BACT|nr:polysaccharide biosynthesis C-terminal domain-containing protein [Hymenobacter citatus]MBC6611940.1 polysaccharide biosynthesis C-terminal domain-containing protein [Hymenobacter citatus]